MSKLTASFIACTATILLGVGLSPLANAAPWTFYSSGTIDSGYDTTGEFGSISTDLSGQTYSQLFTLDPSLYSYQDSNPAYLNGSGSLIATATNTVTVNGISKTYTWDFSQYSWGQAFVSSASYGVSQAYQYQYGYLANDSRWLQSQSYLFSYANDFNLLPSYDQVWSRNVQSGDVGNDYFRLANNLYQASNTHFNGTPTFMSINAPIAADPEPETYAMLLAGLGLVGLMARRRKQNFVA